MKHLSFCVVLLMGLLAVSCKKDTETLPGSPAVASVTINVEYRITSESSNIEAEYLYPNADGKLVVKSELITRGEHSVSFKSTKGNFYSLEAWNVDPARKSVFVQIYIDGILFKEGSSNSSSQKAIASGNY